MEAAVGSGRALEWSRCSAPLLSRLHLTDGRREHAGQGVGGRRWLGLGHSGAEAVLLEAWVGSGGGSASSKC